MKIKVVERAPGTGTFIYEGSFEVSITEAETIVAEMGRIRRVYPRNRYVIEITDD